MSEYLFKNGYHLSASQIILLRPDILLNYFKRKYKGESIDAWFMQERITCIKCFDKVKQIVPAR